MDYDPKIASAIQLQKSTESLESLMANRNTSHISPLMRSSRWTGHFWKNRKSTIDNDFDMDETPDQRSTSEPRISPVRIPEDKLEMFRERRQAMAHYLKTTRQQKRLIPKASERMMIAPITPLRAPTPAYRPQSTPTAATTKLSESIFASLRSRSVEPPRQDRRTSYGRSGSLTRGSSLGRTSARNLRVERHTSVDRSASVERSASLERSSKNPAPYLRRYIPHYASTGDTKGTNGLRDTLREQREKRRTNATQQHGNRKFREMTKEDRNEYMLAFAASRSGSLDIPSDESSEEEKEQHSNTMAEQHALLSEALGLSKQSAGPNDPQAPLHPLPEAGEFVDDETSVFRVEFGDGPLGLSFDLSESNAGLVVTQSEGAAKAKGVREGDMIVEVNGTMLPFDFTEEDLFDLLTQPERPISVGFLRGVDTDDDPDDEAFYSRFTAMAEDATSGRERER